MMFASTSKAPKSAALPNILRRSLHSSWSSLAHFSQSASDASTRAQAFFTSDDPLIRVLRKRQEAYRLRQSTNKKADRQEAIQLAKSEIRWALEHVRKHQPPPSTPSSAPSSKSKILALDRPSRRKLIAMATHMTRNNTPLSYLLGSIPFGNLPEELTVRPPVLLPRPETEHWATQVVETLIQTLQASQRREVRVVDLCTGSGCIALLVAHALREHLGAEGRWKVFACDRSPLAVELAKENAEKLGFRVNEDGANVHIVEADIFDDADMDRLAKMAEGPFDLVLSNPPYIPRREYNTLSAEVRSHEDPAALIGERSIAPATNPSISPNSSTTSAEITGEQDARQQWLDRNGLSFHARLAELLYRPSFSTHTPPLPRLVAEYGKGQSKAVAKLHTDLKPPAQRLPRIVQIEGNALVVVGVGNATTHPDTRHSIGQVVLDPLLRGLIDQDMLVRAKLKEMRDQLERDRVEILQSGRIDRDLRKDWTQPVPQHLPVLTLSSSSGAVLPETPATFDPSVTLEAPLTLTKVAQGKSGGWSATLPLLIPANPNFFSPHPQSHTTSDQMVYQINISLYKPSQAMNLSGVGLKSFLLAHHPRFIESSSISDYGEWRVENDVLVLQDELDLAFGEVKRRDWGSARGHNGIRDIIARLDISESPSPTATSSTTKSKGKGQGGTAVEEMGPRLARLRIGIGRPEAPPAKDAKSDECWLPRSLAPKKNKHKSVPIDRWVLSLLKQDEMESCTQGLVLQEVQEQAFEWIRDRCEALSNDLFLKKDCGDGGDGGLRVRSEKDQFGVLRSVWVE